MIKRKTIFLASLVILLIIVGYINQKLIEVSNEKPENDYVKYEQELIDLNGFNLDEVLEASGNNIESNVNIVDSNNMKVTDISKNANSEIVNEITQEENRKRLNYYIEYRLTRDKLRADLIDKLQYIIDNANSTEEMKNEAQDKIMELVDLSQKELFIEELIKSKGMDEALVFLTNDNARVVVEIENLDGKSVAKILDIVIEQTGLKASNIKIMKRY